MIVATAVTVAAAEGTMTAVATFATAIAMVATMAAAGEMAIIMSFGVVASSEIDPEMEARSRASTTED